MIDILKPNKVPNYQLKINVLRQGKIFRGEYFWGEDVLLHRHSTVTASARNMKIKKLATMSFK